jgi:hypothetical protein
MRLRLAFALPAVVVAGLGGGWLAGNFATPYIVTDAMFAQFKGNGAKENRLSRAPLRTAKTAKVVADNADTLTRSSILDLGAGPLLFEADVPTTSEYWSVSLFAHNTDTFYVGNDKTIKSREPGRFRLVIRTTDQSVPDGIADAVAVSPSRIGFLLIRATMGDRTDAEAVERLREEVMRSSLGPLGEAT